MHSHWHSGKDSLDLSAVYLYSCIFIAVYHVQIPMRLLILMRRHIPQTHDTFHTLFSILITGLSVIGTDLFIRKVSQCRKNNTPSLSHYTLYISSPLPPTSFRPSLPIVSRLPKLYNRRLSFAGSSLASSQASCTNQYGFAWRNVYRCSKKLT